MFLQRKHSIASSLEAIHQENEEVMLESKCGINSAPKLFHCTRLLSKIEAISKQGMISLAKIDEYVTILVIYVDTQDDPTEALKIITIQESSFSGWGKGERRGCGKGEHLQGKFQN